MSLTKEEILAAAERADTYPVGEGKWFIIGRPDTYNSAHTSIHLDHYPSSTRFG